MEVCQTGIDDAIPAWCVEFEVTPYFVLQGLLELFVLFVFGVIMYKLFGYLQKRKGERKRKMPPVEYPPMKWKRFK